MSLERETKKYRLKPEFIEAMPNTDDKIFIIKEPYLYLAGVMTKQDFLTLFEPVDDEELGEGEIDVNTVTEPL